MLGYEVWMEEKTRTSSNLETSILPVMRVYVFQQVDGGENDCEFERSDPEGLMSQHE